MWEAATAKCGSKIYRTKKKENFYNLKINRLIVKKNK